MNAKTLTRRELALESLFVRDADAVFGFVHARCGSRSVAEDVTAEVFHEVARAAAVDRLDQIGRGWLIDVARKRLIDHWRRTERERRRWQRAVQHYDPSAADAAGPDPDPIMDALDALSDRQRAAMVLRYVDDRSVAQVAESLLMTVPACESLLARARRALRAAYEQSEVST